jgi:hypothetical protein
MNEQEAVPQKSPANSAARYRQIGAKLLIQAVFLTFRRVEFVFSLL